MLSFKAAFVASILFRAAAKRRRCPERPRAQRVRKTMTAGLPTARLASERSRGAHQVWQPALGSAQRRSDGIHVQRIDRRAARHEPPVALGAAEAEVRDNFRRMQER